MEFMDKNNKARAKEIDAALNNVVDDFDKFEHYFLSHWKEFVYASAGILVAVAIIGFIYMLYLNSDKKAIDTLASARTIEELQSALAEYGSHASAATARTRLAHLLFEQRLFLDVFLEITLSDDNLLILFSDSLRHPIPANSVLSAER